MKLLPFLLMSFVNADFINISFLTLKNRKKY